MKERNKTMGEMEKQELATIIKAMTDEDKLLAIKMFPSDMLWDELKRRDLIRERIIAGVKDLVKEK